MSRRRAEPRTHSGPEGSGAVGARTARSSDGRLRSGCRRYAGVTAPGADDYPEALALPLPLHLVGLGRQYVLPTCRQEEAPSGGDTAPAVDPDPAKYPAPGPEEEPEARERGDEDEQLLLFEELLQE
ncbi:hypothetical protein [Streptomyces sp. NPDC127033]|uniref:hypothetical protein n=1 Tax=Streptomyces sp. NPDC127033 TaxID=3347110 RepID=UPI00364CA1D5